MVDREPGTYRRGLALGAIAVAGWSARRARTEEAQTRAQQALADALGEARGLPMKFGQALASPRDEGPLSQLTRSVEPMPLAQVRTLIELSLGRPLAEVFSHMAHEGIAASLGQVHRARIVDGQEVALKIQYPDIRAALGTEMRVLGWLPGFGPVRRWGVDLDGYRKTLAEAMEAELDYRREAHNQAEFAEKNAFPGVVIPRVVQELSGRRLLVQEWISGERVSDVRGWSISDRAQIARAVGRMMVRGLFVTGLVHGDLHAGNVAVRRRAEGPELVVYDYGSLVRLTEGERAALLFLAWRQPAVREHEAAAALSALGFDVEALGTIRGHLSELVELLMFPFRAGRPFRSGHWCLQRRMRSLLGDARWAFRAAAPPRGLLLIRAMQGAFALLDALDVSVDFETIILDEVPERVWSNTFARFVSSAPTEARGASEYRLRVRVEDAGTEVVSVCMPGRSALKLTEVTPPEVLSAAARMGHEPAKIQRRLLQEGLRAQELFAASIGTRTYRVWIDGSPVQGGHRD